MFTMKLVANNEVIIEKTLLEDTVKSIAEIDDVNDINNNLLANLKLNDACIEVSKQMMINHNLDHARLYITNSYFEEPTSAEYDLSVNE